MKKYVVMSEDRMKRVFFTWGLRIWEGGGDRGMGNHGTSAKKFPHVTPSWRLNELTERAVTIEVGSLFQNFTPRIGKNDFL